jgi:hypothetical protein
VFTVIAGAALELRQFVALATPAFGICGADEGLLQLKLP